MEIFIASFDETYRTVGLKNQRVEFFLLRDCNVLNDQNG